MTDETGIEHRERCPFALEDGIQCVLPRGHAGDDHEYSAALPPDIARLLAAKMDALDAALTHARRANRAARISTIVSLAVIATYVTLALTKILT